MTWAGWGVIAAFTAIAASGTTAAISGAQQEKEGKRARKDADDARVAAANLGNLDDPESASKKLFRKGLFFTSPTGLTSGSGSRGQSRLMGK